MISRTLDSRLPLIVYNPAGAFSAEYCKSVHDAGGLPVFDTAFMEGNSAIGKIKELEGTDLIFGVRVNFNDSELLEYLNNTYIPNLSTVVLAYNDEHDIDAAKLTTTEYKVVVEILNIGLSERIRPLQPSGIIVRGNEASGKVSKYTSFVLLQWYVENTNIPVFVQGGVGYYTGAGFMAAGAAGLVMDSQLYLTDEAPLAQNYKDAISKLEEKDSVLIGQSLGRQYRFFSKLGTKIVKELKEEESKLAGEENADDKLLAHIAKEYAHLDDSSATVIQSLFYMGQDGIFAKYFVKKHTKVKDVIYDYFKGMGERLGDVDKYDPMKADTELAKDNGTKYPIMQGPMANISDNADFAAEIYKQGALPFFAMGSLPLDLAEPMLKTGKEKVEKFGAGMIGISALNKIIDEHMDLIKEYKVPYALFAGGIPGQIKQLESAGVKAYLHTPAVTMLENAVNNGVTRVIFEGREAGGHVGSLTSMVLWEAGIQKIMNNFSDKLSSMSMIFAGGIGSKTGTAFVSGMAASLVKAGVKVGIQIGTTYLFAKEIVEHGAIKPLYQRLMVEMSETLVTGETLGLSTRALPTPFTKGKIVREHERIKDGLPLKERKEAFEKENLGSLLIGAKAFSPNFSVPGKVTLDHYEEEEAFERGNFMSGDSLVFEETETTVADIHYELMENKTLLFRNLNALEVYSASDNEVNDEVAIVGMGAIYSESNNYDELWKNILDKRYFIKEVPTDRVPHDLHYDPDKTVEDKTYNIIAGIIEQFKFDHQKFGYTEDQAEYMSLTQKMILEAAYQAVEDSGYLGGEKELPKEKTSVIIGTCLGNEMMHKLILKYYMPEVHYYLDQIDEYKALADADKEKVLSALREYMSYGYNDEPADSAALSFEASRIAKHLGLQGNAFVVDAACATSFAALDSGIKALLSGQQDAVVVGGINTNMMAEPFVGFSNMGTLSADGSWPFDERATGFVMGEGAGVFVIKRMKDALRDGDRIHVVLKGLGGSSDGKGKGIAAPSPDGQELALRRCYEWMKNPIKPEDIGYIEAHGTSTKVGDKTEIGTLARVYSQTSNPIGVSSIKSQIGHLLGGAGAAGLVKAILAIKHKTLPPNGQFENLSKAFSLDDSNLFIIKDAKAWDVKAGETRKAAVSAYGFGGINYHCVIEEFTDSYAVLDRKIFADPSYDYNDDRIVITGVGSVLPGALSFDKMWDALSSGKSFLQDIPEDLFHIDYYADESGDYYLPKTKVGVVDDFKFNNIKFRIPPAAASHLDRSQLFALDATGQAINSSKLNDHLEKGNRIGVIVGTTSGKMNAENIFRTRIPLVEKAIKSVGSDMNSISDKVAALLKERYVPNNGDTIPGLLSNIVTGRICNFFGMNGANFTVDSSGSSAAAAIDLAMKGVQNGTYEFAITGGVDTGLFPSDFAIFNKLGLLGEDCSYYDANAAGFGLGEGAAIFAITKYSTAKKYNMDVLAEINGANFKVMTKNDMLIPSEEALADVIERTYNNGHVSPRNLRYLDVAAMANPLYDKVELHALTKAFNGIDIPYGNMKPEFGYFRTAHTAIAMAKFLHMEKSKELLPTGGFNAETTFVKNVPLKAVEEKTSFSNRNNAYGVNSYGLGGTHAHVVMSTLPAWLAESGSATSTSAAGSADVKAAVASMPKVVSQVALLCSGQGAQRSGMMKELYSAYPSVKSAIDRGDALFKAERGYSIKELMFNDPEGKLNDTENTQPSIFLSSVALFDLLTEKGFSADLFAGHSLGEFSALYCAGAISFDDAMKLVIKRSEFMQEAAKAEKGAIMVLFTDAETADGHIKASGVKEVWVANKNSGQQTAVSGKEAGIDALCAYLKEKGVTYKKLNLSGAFHTPLFASAAKKLADVLAGVPFNAANAAKVISNVTAQPYPADEKAAKELLAKQMVSPVEFVETVKNLSGYGIKTLVEAGPGQLLTNLVKKIDAQFDSVIGLVNPKKGEAASCAEALASVVTQKAAAPARAVAATPVAVNAAKTPALAGGSVAVDTEDAGFESFLKHNQDKVKELLYQEYVKARKEEAFQMVEKCGWYTGRVVIPGVSVGLPGLSSNVFSEDNFDKIIRGVNLIDRLSDSKVNAIVDKNITRIHKAANGNARYVEINSTEDVMHLAGQLGYFDLETEYGIKFDYDLNFKLAMAAGLEALKDAHIPLVMNHKVTTTGSTLPDRLMLPKEMQETTGVIYTSLFSGFETLLEEVTNYFYERYVRSPFHELESLYYYIMEKVQDKEVKDKVTDWFFNSKKEMKEGKYVFNKNLLTQLASLGSSNFAQYVGAKGPNMRIDGACASTTQAIALAEDWIRMGRCERVIVIGAESATSEHQNQWIGSGFLAMGAATIKKNVQEAAKPFDATRNGTIVGSGAVGVVVERADLVEKRGLIGQAEILGTHVGNSAFHVSKIDVAHLAGEMADFFDKVENVHGIDRQAIADRTVFMSHETYTPARGGSADAEVSALSTTFGNSVNKITVTNVKGYTGHTLGAGVEDAIMVKALQKGAVPPVANLVNIPENFKSLKFSRGEQGNYEYGFHLAAGFGSQFAFLFLKKLNDASVAGNDKYQAWLDSVTGIAGVKAYVENKTLIADSVPVVVNESGAEVKAAPKAVAAPAASVPAAAGPDIKEVTKTVKTIIAEQTGYDNDMLEDDLDLEADLGIDTVKQVEIFGKISSNYGLEVPEDLQLSDLNTITKLAGYIAEKAGGSAVAAPAAVAAAPAGGGADLGEVTATVKSIIAEQTGYDNDMLENDLDLEADLGIDTVKQVEIFGKISANYGLEVPEDLQLSDLNTITKLAGYIAERAGGSAGAAPVAASAPVAATPAGGGADLGEVTATVKSIIAEQTGYETDMLEADLDLEADLGIDTVKQVEIFGKISSNYGLEVPEDLQLSDLNTITKLAGYIAERAGGSAGAAPVAASAPVAAAPAGGANLSEVTGTVKSIIAEQTGYETEMLEDELDLEADLGIDTVKQVEIFGKISSNYGLEVPEDLQLSDLNTITKLAGYIAERASAGSAPAAPAAAAPSAPVASAPAAGVDLGEVTKVVKGIIAEQTGYETEMLEDELDLEADLGIDTVKQVEIFGKISSNYGLEVPEDLQLSDLNTITKLAAYIAEQMSGAKTASAPKAATAPKAAAAKEEKSHDIKRFTVTAEERPDSAAKSNVFEGKKFLVIKDGKGFADEFIVKAQEKGAQLVTVAEKDADFAISYASFDAMEKSIEAIAEANGDINGIFHFGGVDSLSARKVTETSVNRAVKSQFILARKMMSTLNKSGNILAALSFNSVVFPYGEAKNKIVPEFAGISGLYKSLRKELPEMKVKVVDLEIKSPEKEITGSIETFMNEIMSADKETEIGYSDGKRYGLRLVDKDPEKGESIVKEGDTFVVTGGARGITYNILKSLVEEYKCNLVIMGRSDITKVDEKYLAAGITEKDIFNDLKGSMEGAKPVEIKNAASKVMQLVETVKNIDELKSHGVKVDYHSCDVSDGAKMKEIISSYEKVDGALHAAGLEISQVLDKMTNNEFNLVFNTKVDGLLNIMEALKDKEYRYLMTFSSVTARFGNEGQCNYTAANDMIGKMLQAEHQKNPDKQYKVYDWTAWEGAGMATKETVKKVLEARGLAFLPLDFGVQSFMEDLLDRSRDEVLVSGMDHAFDPDKILPQPGMGGVDNFLEELVEKKADSIHFARTLTAERDLFLFDHVLDGVPLFLGSTGLETMAEAACQLVEGKELLSMQEFQIPYGIKLLKNRPKALDVTAKVEGESVLTQITSLFRNPKGVAMGDPKLHYQAKFQFGDKREEKRIEIPTFHPADVDGGFQNLIYHPKRLFMDGLFRTVEELLSFTDDQMIVQITNSSDREFFAGVRSPKFTTDPVLIDAMFQTGGMLDVMTTEKIILPYMMKEMRFYRQTEKNVPYICITDKIASGKDINTYNLTLCDKEGNVYIEINDFQMIQVNNVEEGMGIADKITRK